MSTGKNKFKEIFIRFLKLEANSGYFVLSTLYPIHKKVWRANVDKKTPTIKKKAIWAKGCKD